MERRLTAILAADVAGYSSHTDRNDEVSTDTLREHLAAVRDSIAAHKGHIFTLAGDGVVAEFPSIVEAIRCAVMIQRHNAERNASVPERERMQFRIGVNLGDVICNDGNLYGTGVNVAVRLQTLAEPGGICVSQTVYDQVRKIDAFQFYYFGKRLLKGIAEPVRVYRLLLEPLSWSNRIWSYSKIYLRRPEVATLIFLLILAVSGGASYYLRQPAGLWSTLLSDAPASVAIAVLPFVNKGDSPVQQSFSSNLTEDIMAGLSRMRDLSVIEYQGKAADVRDIGRELKARYVLEGTIAPSGGDLFYIRPKLKDVQTGRTVWSKRFDRDMATRSLVDDEIACQIIAKIAGGYGIIESTAAKSAKRKSPDEVQAADLVAQARAMMQWEWTEENFTVARKLLSKALELDPNSGPARRERAWYNLMGAIFDIDAQPAPMRVVTAEALEAVKLEPDDGRARMVAASAYFFTKKLKLFDDEATQAEKDAPCDPEVLAVLGALLANSGQWPRGVSLVERANALNPAAAQGWYHSTMYLDYYLREYYQRALDLIRQSPDFQSGVTYAYFDYLAICGQLGRRQGALERPQSGGNTECIAPSPKEAWRKILEQDPGATAATFKAWYTKWNFRDEDIDKLMDGAYKTGVLAPEARVRPVIQQYRAEPNVER